MGVGGGVHRAFLFANSTAWAQCPRLLVRGRESQGGIYMAISGFALAAAAAAQAVTTFYAQPAATQATIQPSAPAAVIAASPTTNAILRVGTEVPLSLSEELTTKGKKLRVGHRFHLQTS